MDTALAVVKLIQTRCRGYRLDLKYPILFGIARILEGKQTPLEGLEGLMNMPMQMENFDERLYNTKTPTKHNASNETEVLTPP